MVPDVLLSWIALRRGIGPAAVAAGWAVLGACIGGLLMWNIGRGYPDGIRDFLDNVPAISQEMIAQAEAAIRGDLAGALFSGAVSGVPYKLLAATAPSAGVGWPALLFASVPARSVRFLAVVLITAGADRIGGRWLGQSGRAGLLFAWWAAFYAVFWSTMPN